MYVIPQTLRASRGLRPLAPYQGSALDPLGTLCGPQIPRPLTLPLTTNPRSAPDHPSEYLSINLKKINLNLVYFVVWLSYKKGGGAL